MIFNFLFGMVCYYLYYRDMRPGVMMFHFEAYEVAVRSFEDVETVLKTFVLELIKVAFLYHLCLGGTVDEGVEKTQGVF